MKRNYLLLTPGPLSTSETVREAMLQDWCTWDKDYNEGIVTPIRKGLLAIAGLDEVTYTDVLLQGSGTYCVEATIGAAVKPTDKLLILANGAYGKRMAQIADYYHIPLFPLLRFYNLLKIQGLGAHRRHKYYPEFDIRALSKPGGAAQIKTSATAIPPELGIPSQLLPILERGQKAGFLDDEYKPIPKSMTRPQQKRCALLACREAGLDNYCNRYGKMWGCDYNGVDESRGAAQRRKAIDSLFAQAIINKAKLK